MSQSNYFVSRFIFKRVPFINRNHNYHVETLLEIQTNILMVDEKG